MTESSKYSAKGFAAYDADNPEVWELFVKFTFQAITRGKKRYGVFGIFHLIRWETSITTTDPDFKLSNNWAPFYARKFHKEYPQHAGFFVTRPSRADVEDNDEIADNP